MGFMDKSKRVGTVSNQSLLRRLEPRIVFDGAALATGLDAAPAPDQTESVEAPGVPVAQTDDAAAPDFSPEAVTPSEIVFVDGRIKDADLLIAGLSPDAQVFTLDPAKDGLSQISDILSQQGGLSAIHIFSHGDAGKLFLGSGELSAANLGDNAEAVSGWGDALTSNGDLLLWGCDVAATSEGARFVSELSVLTGADVAASVDTTGAAAQGGDWVLETQTGSVEADSPFGWSSLMAYAHVLNTAPQVTAGAAETVNEDTGLSFSNGGGNQITIADVDNDNLSMTISVTNGTLTLGGTANLTNLLGNGTNSVTFQGLATDVTTALNGLTYQGSANFNGADSLSIQANDGTATSNSAIGITVSAVEDGPQLVANSMTVDEGNTPTAVTLQNSDLQVTDAESAAANLTYSLVSLPSDGTLRVNGATATLATTFTQADIAAGNVTYTHNGAENATDSLTFNVTDGAGQTLGNTAFTINVNAVNDPLEQVAVENGTVIEGQALVIGESLLDHNDIDTADTSLVYTVTAGSVLAEGSLTVNGVVATVGSTFTQAQINANQVVYTHAGGEPATAQNLSFSVTDGTTTNTGTVNIAVTPLNDTPTPSVNGLTLVEGTTAAFAAVNVTIVDPDSSNEQIIYKIESLPTNGTLTLGGNPVVIGTTFSQAQLSSLSYAHNGSETTSDTFNFTARDGAGGVVAATAVPITITPVNDQVTASGSATVFEGESTSINLNISDNDDANGNITINFLTVPANGTLMFNGNPVSASPTAFILASQIGLLTYVHNGSDGVGGDPADTSFDIKVTDSGGGTATPSSVTTTINIDVQPVNDDPTLPTNVTATVAEGGTLTVNNTQLSATDVDSPDSTLTYQVESLPTSGILLLDGVHIGVGATFTQADIDSGKLQYVNQSQSAGTDNFTFTLRDGQINIVTALQGALRQTPGGALDTQTFNINITEVNDAPVLTANTNQALAQGDTVTVTTASLNASDVDSTDAQTIFTVTTVPSNGELKLNGTALTNGQTFTLDDVKNNRVTYTHTSAQPTGTDTFQFQLTDSTGLPAAPATNTHSFIVTPAPPIPDNTGSSSNPTVGTNNAITIDEHGTGSLTGSLASSDIDQPAGSLIYRITTDAQFGQVLLNGAPLGVGSLFTQADIDSGLVTFKSDGSNDPAATQASSDSITLTLIDGAGGEVTGIVVNFNISPINDAPVVAGPSSLVTSEDVSINVTGVSVTDVDEDATANAELKMTLNATAGTLSLGTIAGLTFTTGDGATDASMVFTGTLGAINTALATLSYLPNANVGGGGTITIVANDQGNTGTDPGNTGDGTSEEGTKTINVTIRAINDAPTIGVNNTLTTISEGATGTITSGLLAAADVDNGTTEQFFVITTLPADGTLLLNGTALTKGGFFTQDDINNNRVTYQHNGSENFRDTFNFTLTDGSTSAVTGTFNIEITPVNDTPTVPTNTGMVLTEAQTKVITAAMLAVGDPDGSAEISLAEDNETFVITTTPGAGTILFNGVAYAGQALTNADIAANRLSYQHDGSETFTDSMVITVNDNSATAGASHTTTATFNFVIAPLNDDPVIGNNVPLVVDEAGSGTIGATQLGNATTSTVDPDNNERQVQYRVTSGVSTGQLFLNGKAIGAGSSFTLEDIQQNRLTYTHNGDEVFTDAFNFRVEDGGGGFVDGTYNITVNAINDTPVLTAPGAQSVDEDTNLAITGVSVADVDAHLGTNQVTATLSVTNGTITLATTSGIGFDAGSDGAASMTIRGTLSDVNAAIATLTYKGTANFNGNDTLNINFNDLGNFGADPMATGGNADEQANASIAITVGPINDAPTVTPPAGQNVTEDQTLTLSGATAIVIGDVDADDTAGDTLTVTVSATSGTLTLATTSGLSGVSGDTSKSVTFTGTRAEVNAAIDGLVYDSDLNFAGTDTINVSVNDNGNTGSGGAKTGTGSLTVTVDPINDTPVVTVPANQTAPEDAQLVFSSGNSNLIQIADADADTGLIDVTIALSGATPGTVTLSQTTDLAFQSGTTNGSATMTVRGTLASINAALSGAIYQGPANANGFTTTMTVSVDDRGNTGADPTTVGQPGTGTVSNEIDSAMFDITVPAVNDAPTVTTPGTQTTIEDDTGGVTFGNIGFADVDADPATDTMTVTLSVANGAITLSAAAVTSIGAGNVTNNGSGSVTVTGTLNQLNAAINTANTITYVSNANFAGADPLTISVSDGGSTGVDPSTVGLPATGTATTEVGTGTVAINVTAVNDAPTITVPGAQSVDEDTNLVLTGATAISIADIDSATSDVTATLTVTSGTLTANGATGPLTSITGQGTNTLTLVGTAAEINTAIASLTYLGTANANGTDTLNINVNDGGNTGVDPSTIPGRPVTGDANNEQADASVALTVNAINDTPTVTVPGQQTASAAAGVTFSSGNGNQISVADVDANEVSATAVVRATIAVTTGNLALNGIAGLSFINGGNNSGSMVIEGTLAAINTALDGLVFTAGGDSDTTATLSVTLNDKGNVGADPNLTGDGSSEQGTGTVDIQISEINDTPTITAPATVNGSEDTVIAFTGGNQVQIGDVDAFSSDLRVTLSVANGTLSLTPGTLAFSTGDGTADSTMIFEGTLSEINTALATLTYLGNTGYNANQGTETLNITVNDKGNTGVDPGTSGDANSEQATHAVGITIAAINDAPTLNVPGAQTVSEDTSIGITGISFADTDIAENPTGEMRITLSAANGTLTLATTAGLDFITGTNGSGAMVIEGTLAEVNAAVATLTYQGNTNFNGTDTISVKVNDKGNTGTDPGNTGDANSEEASATIGVTVNPINDAPTIVKPADQTINEDTDLTISGVAFGDVDSAGNDVTATLSVTNGTLTVTASTAALTSATGSGTKTVTLVGTVAEINAAISGMTYRGDLNFHGSDTLALAINDGGNNGADPSTVGQPATGTPTNEIASANVGITVSPVNDAPTISTSVNVTTPEDTQIGIDLTTNAADVDGNTGAGDAGISSYTVQTLPSATAGVLFLSDGTTAVVAGASLTPTEAAGLIFKPVPNSSGGPFNFTYITTDSDGADSATATGAITVSPVNDTPTITPPTAQTVNEDTNLTITGTSFADIDSGTNDVTATLSVGEGTLTLAGTIGAGLAVSNDGTATVTLVGTVAEINAAITSITYRGDANFHGADTLNLTINDQGNTGADPLLTGGPGDEEATASVGITVNPVNDPPVATPFTTTTPENVTVLVTLAATDADVGTNTPTNALLDTITITSLPPASQGVLTLSNGTTPVVAGTPITPAEAADLRFVPATNFNGTVNVTFIATDTAGTDSAPATGTVIVSSTNTAPSVSTNTGFTVNEGQPVTLSNSALSVTDPDNTAAQLTYTVNTVPANGQILKNGSALGIGGTFTQDDIDNGRVTYQHNGSETTSDTFDVTATDPGGLNTGGTITVPVTVNPVNDAPTIVVPGAQTTAEDTSLAITGITVADTDAGTSDMTVTVSAPNGTLTATATGGLTSVSGAGTGTLTLTGSATALNTALATLSYGPNLNYNGADTITVLINDGGNTGADPSSIGLAGTGTATDEQASSTIAVTITAVNDIPVANTTPGTPDVTIEPGGTFTGFIPDYFTDPDGGPYVFAVGTPPANGTLVITDPATGEFEYTPNPGFEGTDTFGFTVDGAAIPFPTPVLVQVTILVQNTNIAFIDPSTGQPADIPDGSPPGGIGNNVPGVNFDPRQIQFAEGDLNLANNNEYIRAVVEDRIGALESQYGAGSGGEVLGEALGTPQENRNNNANIGEVTLSGPSAGAGGFFGGGSSPQFLGLSNLPTEAGGPQPPAEDGEADENAEDQTPEEQDEEENQQGAPTEPAGDGEQDGETTPPAPGDQTDLQVPAETPQFASTAGMRFSDQIAAEAQRMEQQRISLLGAVNGLNIPAASDAPGA